MLTTFRSAATRSNWWLGGAVLAEDNNTLTPALGRFETSVVTYNTLPDDPNLGNPIEIRLVSLSQETNFDNVRLLATAQTCVQPPAGLISWWPGDGNADDIVGGNNGILQNGATFAPGFVTSGTGQAFSFDGVDDFVSVAHNNNLNVASHTIEAWIRTPAFPPSTFATILSKTTPAPVERTFGLFIEPSVVTFPLTPGALLGDFTNGPNNFNSSRGNTVVTDGNFHHVAVTYDVPSRTMRLYVDGNLDVETMFAPGTPPDTHPLPATIGAEFSGIGSNARLFFTGLIDELELYNRALSASEIQAIFNAGSAGKCRPVTGFDLDHFECYRAWTAKGTPRFEPLEVTLDGQSGSKTVTVLKPVSICIPVDKNGEGIINPDAYLTCYRFKIKDAEEGAEPIKSEVLVQNQFGEQTLTVLRPHFLRHRFLRSYFLRDQTLCVPSSKAYTF